MGRYDVKKTNNKGWRQTRQILLTDKRFINADSKTIKSSLEYVNMSHVFSLESTNQIIIINNPHKEGVRYFLDFPENFGEFLRNLKIYSKKVDS